MRVACLTFLWVFPTFRWVYHGSNVLPILIHSFSLVAVWFRSLLRGTCSAEYLFAFFLVVTGYCWIVFLAYPISLSFSCAGFRPRLISHPGSRHRHRGLLRLRFHTWRLSSDLPGLRDSPPDLLLRLAWLGVLPLAPFPGWVICVSPVVRVSTT